MGSYDDIASEYIVNALGYDPRASGGPLSETVAQPLSAPAPRPPLPAPVPPPPAFPVPGTYDAPETQRAPLSLDEMARARAHPVATPEQRPMFPEQRPSGLAAMVTPPSFVGRSFPRRSPPADGGGVPRGGLAGLVGDRGPDIGIIADIFPGLFPRISARRQREREMEFQRRSRLDDYARQEAREAAASAARAPVEARESERFQWEREDREREARGRSDKARNAQLAADPNSDRSKNRRAAFAAANPDFVRWLSENDSEVWAGVAAGDEKTWSMLEGRAEQWRKEKAEVEKRNRRGAPRVRDTASMNKAIKAIRDGDVDTAMTAAEDALQNGDRKTYEEIRKLAAQGALAGARADLADERLERRTQAKQEESARSAIIPGWRRTPGAPELDKIEARNAREIVAANETMRTIAARMKEIDAKMTTAERAKAMAGLDTQYTAEQMQLQRQATTALRQMANMGVPSLAEMAIVNQQAPELTTISGWVNGVTRFDAMVRALDRIGETQLGVMGYERDKPRTRTITAPSGETGERSITDAQAARLKAKGFTVE